MTAFIVYDSTGNILRSGICSAESLLAQANEGEFVIECEPDVRDDTHRVENHKIVEK